MSVTAEAPPHAPRTGWARRVLGDYHVTGLFWYRFHRWSVSSTPEWTLGIWITIFTTFFFFTIWNIRRAIGANLENVLGPCGFFRRQRRIYATMWAFAWCLSERYERLATDRKFDVAVDGMEHWQAATANGRGCVLVTAHLGLYEVGSMMPSTVEKRHVHLIREPEIDPRAQEFIRESVRAVETEHYSMHFQSEDPLQGMFLLDVLRRGEIVAIQGDRPRTGGRIVPATLFGRPLSLPAGPASLARAAGVPLLPVFAIREGRRRYRCVFAPPIEPWGTADRQHEVAEATARVGEAVERAVRSAPHQWFVFREIWS
ncbi:MAG TPA: lysophospholipid acyltransferase family protein [Candidatus Polarisedimenticolaceae bacterium]|nr:lysophospholipid acyltransferase family protein [Candidatus Polarisedimenticolaceae bacterium]